MSNAPPGLIINLPGIDPHDSERRRFVSFPYDSVFIKKQRLIFKWNFHIVNNVDDFQANSFKSPKRKVK